METLGSRVNEVALEIAGWEISAQESLMHTLADLNYRRGLKELSEKIQRR